MTTSIVRRLFLAILTLLLVASAIAIGFYAYVPHLERRMTFHPSKHDPKMPWQLPPATADVHFSTSDGVLLHGWFMTGASPRTGITVLQLHGNAGTLRAFSSDAVVFQRRGFDVFLVDYRGYGKSEGETLDETTLRLDGLAAMRHLTAERGVDPKTVALFGYSLGSIVAADLAVSQPCRAVALMAPLASARRQAESVFPRMPAIFFGAMTNRFDTVGKIGGVRCPVIVVHGDRDDLISVDQGRAVYEAAPAPKRLVIVAGGGHGLYDPNGQGHLAEVAAFFVAPQ